MNFSHSMYLPCSRYALAHIISAPKLDHGWAKACTRASCIQMKLFGPEYQVFWSSCFDQQRGQKKLLDILSWFLAWKKLHDQHVAKEEANEYNYFAYETWFCIKLLLLRHVSVIQLYCIGKGVSIRRRSMNTDCVEWFFADARQMVAGSTNKLTARIANHANKKASAFNAAKCNLGGNNKTGEDYFGRSKRY